MSAADTAAPATTPSAGRSWWRAPPRDGPSGAAQLARSGRGQLGELALWVVLVATLTGATALLVAAGVHYAPAGRSEPAAGTLPLTWPPRLTPRTALAPALAAGALLAATLAGRRPAGHRTPAFGRPLILSYLVTVAWWLALGAASRPGERVAGALLAAGDRAPSDLLHATSSQPPGPALLVWVLTRSGLHGSLAVGLAFTALGALVVPLVALAVRSLCHEPAARRLLPVLAFAPWAPFAVASRDAVTAAVAAAALAVGVVGCERGRRAWWALGAGLLLGVAGLFSFPAMWLGVAVAAAYFVRRRPLLNVITGVGALVPLFALRLAGYSWPDGLARAGTGLFDYAAALTWLVPDLLVVLLCCGPVLVRAARRVAMTPGWPFLVGATAAALFALLDGLASGGVATSWLSLFPWLLVAALAPRPRPAQPGDTSSAGAVPYGLVGAGAAVAVVLAALLAT
ncbi:hypothetical protein [Pseudofrankia sp. DC12]|uniref:hypothetical protein n=1 Tax=Pseudofrankia sp. DC12 TaxID=683315 RepID=UPI000B27D42F|nr:hypothetical protein [Pseudofrankia sp. DC12]